MTLIEEKRDYGTGILLCTFAKFLKTTFIIDHLQRTGYSISLEVPNI